MIGIVRFHTSGLRPHVVELQPAAEDRIRTSIREFERWEDLVQHFRALIHPIPLTAYDPAIYARLEAEQLPLGERPTYHRIQIPAGTRIRLLMGRLFSYAGPVERDAFLAPTRGAGGVRRDVYQFSDEHRICQVDVDAVTLLTAPA